MLELRFKNKQELNEESGNNREYMYWSLPLIPGTELIKPL